MPVSIPENAYLDAAGNTWSCERGFKKSAAGCVALQIPENAHIDHSGNDWDCNAGFRNLGASCSLSDRNRSSAR